MGALAHLLAVAAAVLGGQQEPRPNLLLVTIDTLRADRVGAYGHAPARTPNLDRMAREGVLVEEVVMAVPQTRPSHATLFTGRHPFEHGLRDNTHGPLDPRWPTLASLLGSSGYQTAGFIGAYPVARPSGLDRGFAVFDDPFGGHERATTRSGPNERLASDVIDAALAWLKRSPRSPFFLWVHLFDPHAPYEPPEPFASRFARDPYDGEVAYADSELGRLLSALEAQQLAQDTLVVATSDHGEGLGEHREDEHMLLVYDSTLCVPLVLRWPGRLPAGARVSGQFRAVDLLPTLLDLLGLPPVATSGASRAPQLRKGASIPESEAYAESLYGEVHYGWAPLRTLRARGFKYLEAPRAELYDLRADPRETHNRLQDLAGTAQAMRDRLRTYDTGGPVPSSQSVDPETAERLAALGYVADTFSGGTPSGADPKDKVGEFGEHQRGMREGIRLYRSGEVERAADLLSRFEQTEITSFNVFYYLGRCLLRLGRFDDAIPRLERALSLAPDAPPVYVSLAEAQRGAGRQSAAEATLARGLGAFPANAELLFAQGQLLKVLGRAEPALAALEQARGLEPDAENVRAALADLYRNAGRLDAARSEAEAAVRLAPGWAGGHLALGLVHAAAGHAAEAARSLREALRLEPDQPDALFYLAAIEVQAGGNEAALALLERLRVRTPGYPGAEALEQAARASAGGEIAVRLLRLGTKQAAEAVRQRLAEGEEISTVVREMAANPGSGADLGSVRVGDLEPALRAAGERLAAGEVSEVIQDPRGFLLLVREQ